MIVMESSYDECEKKRTKMPRRENSQYITMIGRKRKEDVRESIMET
jgi:hypothetical protein